MNDSYIFILTYLVYFTCLLSKMMQVKISFFFWRKEHLKLYYNNSIVHIIIGVNEEGVLNNWIKIKC